MSDTADPPEPPGETRPGGAPDRLRRRRRRSAWLVAGLLAANVGVAAFVAPVAVDRDDDTTADGDADGAGEPSEAAEVGPYLMDPHLFETADRQWAVGSSIDGVTMPLMEMADGGGSAREVGGALVRQPDWTTQGFVGPSVVEDDGTWWLLFAAQDTDTGRYCLGAASTTDVSEGFEPADEPLWCTDDRDLLDPSTYQGDDGLILTWAERTAAATAADGTPEGPDTWRINAAPLELSESQVGEASELLTGEADGWEAGMVDGPALIEMDGTLVLLYSGNQWGTEGYASGYAVCQDTTSTCERRTVDEPLEIPLDDDAGELIGLGSLQPVTADGDPQVAGHGLTPAGSTGQSEPVAVRAGLSWGDDALTVEPATAVEITSDEDDS